MQVHMLLLKPKVEFKTKHFFQGLPGVAALLARQQGNFLLLHLHNAFFRYFQTTDAVNRADVEIPLKTLGNLFCIVQLQEVHILKLEHKKLPQNGHTRYFSVNTLD